MKTILLLTLLVFCLNFSNAQSGELDPTFGAKGIVKTNIGNPYNYSNYGKKVLLQSDGSMFLIYESGELTLISKKHADGSPDLTYGNNGLSASVSIYPTSGAMQADGKIVVVGSSLGPNVHSSATDFAAARFNTDGSLDNNFDGDGLKITDLSGFETATSLVIQSDGKIVVAGSQNFMGDPTDYAAVVRYNTNGSLDNSFASGGVQRLAISGGVNSMAIQTDGKILIGGYGTVLRDNTDGTLDNSFNGNGQLTISGTANSIAIQNDSKIAICGSYSFNGTNYGFSVSRFNIDGSTDNTFSGDGVQITEFGGTTDVATSMVIQTDGKIAVGGYTGDGINNNFAIARYTTDGIPDISFSGDGMQITDFSSSNDYVNSIALQNDGKLVALGYTINGTNTYVAVSRYQTNGNPDTSFDGDGMLTDHIIQGSTFYTSSAIQSDGKLVAAGYSWNGTNYDFTIARYNINGSLDNSFSGDGIQMTDFGATDERANAITIQSDGKILIAGSAGGDFGIARYNTDGSLDNTFDGDGKQTTDFGSSDKINAIIVQSDGKILAGGTVLARYNTNGSLDLSFNGSGNIAVSCNAVALQHDGKIVAIIWEAVVSRYNPDGSADNTFGDHEGLQLLFGPTGSLFWRAKSLVVQNDGKIVIGGYVEDDDPRHKAYQIALMRLNSDGTNDITFNGGQTLMTSIFPYSLGTSVQVQSDNKIILGGYSNNGSSDNFTVVRYNTDGSLDNSFSINGIQITQVSVANDRIASIALGENGLYAVGYGQFPGNFGVVARYLVTEGGPFPVSVTDFTAVLKNKIVLLKWQTSSELNFSGFTVQRSADSTNFSAIEYIAARGNRSRKTNYTTVDKQPIPGTNYYRLKMVDAAGKFTYSKIVSVNVNEGIITFSISPNPAKDILSVRVSGDVERSSLQIIDAGGRKLKEVTAYLKGITSIPIDINSLPKGVYNLQLFTKTKIETKLFIKE